MLATRVLVLVERTGALIHLVDGTQEDVAGAYRTVRAELEAYGEGLADKPEVLALNKIDALDKDTRKARAAELKKAAGVKPLLISGVSGEGVTELLRVAWREVRRTRGEIVDDDHQEMAQPEGWTP